MNKNNLTKKDLWALRKEIILGSIFTNDYKNSFDIEPRACQDFFDGYLEYIAEDNSVESAKSLYNWYCILEDPFYS